MPGPVTALKPFIQALAINQEVIHAHSPREDAPVAFVVHAPGDFTERSSVRSAPDRHDRGERRRRPRRERGAQSQRRRDGVPTGIRTPVATVKGLCPRPLDDGDVVVEPDGIEPSTSCMPCRRSPS
jgi:hypothetical protein